MTMHNLLLFAFIVLNTALLITALVGQVREAERGNDE